MIRALTFFKTALQYVMLKKKLEDFQCQEEVYVSARYFMGSERKTFFSSVFCDGTRGAATAGVTKRKIAERMNTRRAKVDCIVNSSVPGILWVCRYCGWFGFVDLF